MRALEQSALPQATSVNVNKSTTVFWRDDETTKASDVVFAETTKTTQMPTTVAHDDDVEKKDTTTVATSVVVAPTVDSTSDVENFGEEEKSFIAAFEGILAPESSSSTNDAYDDGFRPTHELDRSTDVDKNEDSPPTEGFRTEKPPDDVTEAPTPLETTTSATTNAQAPMSPPLSPKASTNDVHSSPPRPTFAEDATAPTSSTTSTKDPTVSASDEEFDVSALRFANDILRAENVDLRLRSLRAIQALVVERDSLLEKVALCQVDVDDRMNKIQKELQSGLVQALTQLQAASDEISTLRAENERLRKSGDETVVQRERQPTQHLRRSKRLHNED